MIDVEHVFVTGSDGNNELLEIENITRNDIIQSSLAESYDSLVFKNFLAWNWFQNNCYHADFVIKLDSDVLIHPFRLEDLILSIEEDENFESMRGFVYPKKLRKVHTNDQSRFYVAPELYSQKYYPPYAAGGSYIL